MSNNAFFLPLPSPPTATFNIDVQFDDEYTSRFQLNDAEAYHGLVFDSPDGKGGNTNAQCTVTVMPTAHATGQSQGVGGA